MLSLPASPAFSLAACFVGLYCNRRELEMKGKGIGQFLPGWLDSLSRPPTIAGPSSYNSSVSHTTFQSQAGLGPHPGTQALTPYMPISPLGVLFSRARKSFCKSLFPEAFIWSPKAHPPHWRPPYFSVLLPSDALAFWPGVGTQSFVSLNPWNTVPHPLEAPPWGRVRNSVIP